MYEKSPTAEGAQMLKINTNFHKNFHLFEAQVTVD